MSWKLARNSSLWLSQNHGLNLSIFPQSTLAVSNALWQATLRASSCGSHLIGCHSSSDSGSSLVAAGYLCLCIWSLGKRGYCRLFSFSVDPHKREDLVAFLRDRHCGKYLISLSGRSGIPLIPWQSDLPLGWVPMHYLGGLNGPYALPLSTLTQQHAGTSHPGLLTSEEFPTPTWGTHQG